MTLVITGLENVTKGVEFQNFLKMSIIAELSDIEFFFYFSQDWYNLAFHPVSDYRWVSGHSVYIVYIFASMQYTLLESQLSPTADPNAATD